MANVARDWYVSQIWLCSAVHHFGTREKRLEHVAECDAMLAELEGLLPRDQV